MAVFVDTGALIALIARADRHHEAAVAEYERLTQHTLVTSVDVFDEFVTRTRRVLGHRAAVEAGRAVRENGRFHVLDLRQDDRERAWETFETFGETVKSLTDCTSAALMDRLQIDAIFTFDNDFRTLGKTGLPG